MNLPRRNEVQRAQAEKALIFYDHLLKTTSSPDPVVQIDLARASREAATIQFEVGRFQDAVAGLERSVQLIDAVGAKRPNDREVIREQIQSRTKLGLFLWHTQKKPDRALAELRRAVADAERLVESDPKSVDARSDLAWCLHDLGSVHLENQQLDLALAAHRRAILINRKLIEELPDDGADASPWPRISATWASSSSNATRTRRKRPIARRQEFWRSFYETVPTFAVSPRSPLF